MSLFKLKVTLAVVVLGLSSASAINAQTSKGTLTGVARDATGAVISGATVNLRGQGNGGERHISTSKDGSYRFDAVDPGAYTIDVSASGFKKFEVKDVQVQSTIVTTYDVLVQIGNTSDTVTVEADTATVNAENGQLAGVINASEIDKLPVFSLNPVELALTVPGVQPVPQGGFSNGVDIQVNGARSRANNFLVDGQEVNDVTIGGQAFQIAIPDVLQSVTVITNSANAEYGRAGGGIVNQTTKAGTNTFHGEAFERYFGSGLNSIPGDLRGTGQPNPRTDEHTFGFTAGGPALRNKLFGFGALEIDRVYGREQAGINLLPDAAGYAELQTLTGGPATQVQLLDSYLSGGSYLNQDIHYGTATSGVVKTVNLTPTQGCPVATCPVTFAGFQRPTQSFSEPLTQWLYRIDYKPWDKDSFAFRYIHSRSSFSPDFGNNGNALAGFDTLQGGPSELGWGNWTHVFTPHLLNEFRLSETRVNFQFAPTPQTLANPLNSLYTISLASLSGTTTAGSVGFPALGPNQNFPQGRIEDLYQFQDTISWTRGRHTVRAGVDIGRQIEIDLVSQNAKGTLSFAAGGSGVTSLGNFLLNQLGPSGSATRTFGRTRTDAHNFRNGIFAQDDIKLSSDLTLNLGVRYDFLTNPINNLQYPGIDPNNPYAAINAVYRVAEDYNNISPRIGFAYSPHNAFGFLGDGKTSIRGGFGIFYDSTFSNILINSAQSSPNAVAGTLIQTTGNGLPNATSQIANISPTLNPLSSVTSEVDNIVNPLTYQFNLGIERELPGQIVFGTRYVGSLGKKLYANQQYNFFSGTTGARLNPARGAVNARGNFADSNYNGLEVSGSHNFKHGINVRANYVFSKDLDDGSEVFALGSPTSYDANLAPGGRRQDYGASAYDHRNFFSVAYVWSPAGFRSSNGFANAALGLLTRHWTYSGITQLQSGSWDTVAINGIDNNGDGSSANDRPIVGNGSLPLNMVGIDGVFLGATTPGTYYDIAALNGPGNFVPVTPAQEHFLIPYNRTNQYLPYEIGRNSFQTPGTVRNDMALEKGVGLSYLHFERGTLILRAEASNVFNHNDNGIGDFNTLDAGAGFLDKARAGSQRSVYLWAKVEF